MNTNELYHYGTPRHSGRYPWGSGENPYQHEKGFNGFVNELKKQGFSEKEIADGLGMSTTVLRQEMSRVKAEKRAADAALARRLHDSGMSNTAIGEQMGINESSVRNLLNPTLEERNKVTGNIADVLKSNVADKKYIDVGKGTEIDMGISETRKNNAIHELENEGYVVKYLKVEQVGNPGKYTTVKVLAAPGTTTKELYDHMGDIQTVTGYSPDKGHNFTKLGIEKPQSVNSNRILIRYNEEGGINKDGVIELRKGVEDLSLGNSRYAQVRIGVDDTHYLKGMAMYTDEKLPPGIDIVFNTNKHVGTPASDVFKKMKTDEKGNIDMDNPFGSTIKPNGQSHYIGADGKDHLSAINKVNEEGDWGEWSKTLASQMLSKQPLPLAKRQLDIAYSKKDLELKEISSLTNPEVKRELLKSFADDCDASAVHLKAAALPRQASHVILPFPDMKDNEIYAPNYKDGENVVLIRYPHGGTFEIPELKVNNKNKSANSLIHNARDAVGINSKVAERLSGADFDGDTVLVIPVNDKIKVRTSKPLAALKDFDPKEAYPAYEGMPRLTNEQKQKEMGKVSNLITDMTLKGATPDELARAVKHSMVVIDAEKHYLNYRQSEKDNQIDQLKRKYQKKLDGGYGGASTIISKAKSEERVPARKVWNESKINPKTGEKILEPTGETYTKYKKMKDGSVKATEHLRLEKSTKMAETKDARALISFDAKTPMEVAYADYANKMKALANSARKEFVATKNSKYNPSAKKAYSQEVNDLNAKLNDALKNAPRERKAQILANEIVKSKKLSNPAGADDPDTLKKWKSQALASARVTAGAHKQKVKITDKEWEAIQSGAISSTKLQKILSNADLDEVKKLATPRPKQTIVQQKRSFAKSLDARGYTTAEIAEAIGVSTSTVSEMLNG